jgi:oxaloacetate decarboxylase gamma subunit
MEQTLVSQGMDLLVFGLGGVFVFLAVLVISTLIMSWAVMRFFPEAPVLAEVPVVPSTQPVSASTLAVIQAAIREHRENRHNH